MRSRTWGGEEPAWWVGATLEEFTKRLREGGSVEGTIRQYRSVVGQYLEHVVISDFIYVPGQVNSYLGSIKFNGAKLATLRSRFYALKSFYDVMGHAADWDAGALKAPPPLKGHSSKIITDEGMLAMAEVARDQVYSKRGVVTRGDRSWSIASKGDGGKWMAHRNYLLVRLVSLGLSRKELWGLDLDDLRLTPEDEYEGEHLGRLTPVQRAYLDRIYKPHIHVRSRDGVVSRELDPETVRAVREYLGDRHRKRRFESSLVRGDPQALFVSGRNGGRISPGRLSEILRSIRVEAGVGEAGAGFLAMRRGRITQLIRDGVEGGVVAAEFGWRDQGRVGTFTELDAEEVKRRIREAHPLLQRQLR